MNGRLRSGLLWMLTVWLAGSASADPAAIAEWERQLAANPTNRSVLVWLAKAHHNEATRGGDTAANHTARARTYLDRLLALEPRHAFGRALLGSTTILTARDAFWPGTKIRRVREGLALMDAALDEFPEDPDARFTRAVNNLFLPDLFGRRETVEADFRWLSERVERGEFEPEFRQYVCLFHGRAWVRWSRPELARETWRRGLDIDPKSKVADELRQELAALPPASDRP